MRHGHRRKDGTIRYCDLDFSHLVGPEGGPMIWCRHGKLDPDIEYCVSAHTVGDWATRVGTPCDDPFLARGDQR